jgi:hypothetical protein
MWVAGGWRTRSVSHRDEQRDGIADANPEY